MGQPIVVVEKSSVNRGIVRFETNRALTGMGHERYTSGDEVRGNRPPDELARRLLAHQNVHGVHINGSVVTVDLAKGHTSEGLKQIIEDLYIFYPETDDAEVAPDGEAEGAAPESLADPGAEVAEDVDDAPAPVHEPAVPAAEAEAADEAAANEADEAEDVAPTDADEAEDVAPTDAAPSADAVVEADEVSEAEVQADEGEAPTLDQEPVADAAADQAAGDDEAVADEAVAEG